ncbi:NUT family member 2G-like [Choloepus didactylus]|uniref:NUT family member 2G-like n=1 Tax=Choloepus didactylus TaxID=27675 RepID=UPI0018A06321|nr:NUT family member 2G-like [Choloepus didactylus]
MRVPSCASLHARAPNRQLERLQDKRRVPESPAISERARPRAHATLLVTGDGGPVTSTPGADKVILQVRKQGGPAETPQTQSVILPQTPHISSANGILCGGVNHPPPGNLRPSALQPIIPAMTLRGTKPGNGGWSPGFPPQAPPPVSPLAPNVHSGNALPRTQGASGQGAVASTQSTPSLDDSCKPRSVYENFRCWQRFKSLAQRYFHWSPDAEALSCFLIPVLRSLARRKPTMSLEEGLHRAVQEWQQTSNFDRMIYYEMARKFKEFETEEEGQIEILPKMTGPQGPLRTDPPKLHPLVQKGNVEGQQPVSIPKKAGPKAQFPRQRQNRHQETQKTKAPKEIPDAAVKGYINIMDGLLGSLDSAPEADGKWDTEEHEQQQEEDGIYADPDLLAYIDKLCAEEDFVTKGTRGQERSFGINPRYRHTGYK